MPAKALVFSGYGINCEEETRFAFEQAGADADIVHINDIIDDKSLLKDYQIMAFPGGFSYGDDTGSGKAYANKIKNHLIDEINDFAATDKLIIGICNGFQILTNIGLLEGALTYNNNAQFIDRWVDLEVISNHSPWLQGINYISLPIAHGEGKYFNDKENLNKLEDEDRVAFRYQHGEICEYADYHANPNGSLNDIAGTLAREGRILGMMPHPERALFFTQQPHWTYLKEKALRSDSLVDEHGQGLKIFHNAVSYFELS